MKSMTGFGRGECTDPVTGTGFRTEISTVNRKQLELKFSMPHSIAEYEPVLRSIASAALARGTVNIRIEFIPGTSSAGNSVDFSCALAIWNAASGFQKKYQIPGELKIADLLAMPDAVSVSQSALSGPLYADLLKKSVSSALDAVNVMRQTEGEMLKRDLLDRIGNMERMVNEIEPLAAELPKLQREKLTAHLREILAGNFDDNDERILKEAVIWGDKLDVTEEITRLHCHFTHFRELAAGENSGRSLDFLVQEIFRECNTLGNKAASTQISPKIVALKTELEKIREQVQNIE